MTRIVLVALSLLLCTFPAAAQVLHALIIADTSDRTIGEGAKKNAGQMLDLLGSLAPGFKSTNFTIVEGDEFNCDGIVKFLASTKIESNDVVVFYYTGHGYRLVNDFSRFPRLACSRSFGENPQLEQVALDFRNHGAQLVIAIADACNNELGVAPAEFFRSLNADHRVRLIRLFREYAGTLVVAGADVGQYSWYVPGGGFFSKQFFDTMSDRNLVMSATGSEQPSANDPSATAWSKLLAHATRPIEVKVEQRIVIQQPIFLSTVKRLSN